MKERMKKYVAELIGTCVLVMMGCGSAAIAGFGIGLLGISLAFGLSVLVMVYAIGPISGCHINPAITFAMWINNKICGREAIGYVISQIIGAFIGIGIVAIFAGTNEGLAVNTCQGNYMWWQGLICEIVMTFLFLMVIFGATSEKAPAGFAGIAIGLSLTLIHLVSIPVTNTSVNPARSLAPAVLDLNSVGGLTELWIFIVGPLVGAGLAALCWNYFAGDKCRFCCKKDNDATMIE